MFATTSSVPRIVPGIQAPKEFLVNDWMDFCGTGDWIQDFWDWTQNFEHYRQANILLLNNRLGICGDEFLVLLTLIRVFTHVVHSIFLYLFQEFTACILFARHWEFNLKQNETYILRSLRMWMFMWISHINSHNTLYTLLIRYLQSKYKASRLCVIMSVHTKI